MLAYQWRPPGDRRPGRFLLTGSANRDEREFAEPDRFDIGRAIPVALGFGQGVHFCLGASLARLEAEVAIGSLLRRHPDFSADLRGLEWKRSIVLRGVTQLRLRL